MYQIVLLHSAIISSIFGIFVPKRDVVFEFYSSDTDSTNVVMVDVRFDPEHAIGHNIKIPPNYDADKQTFMYIHGYMSSPTTQPAHAENFFNIVEKGPHCCNFIVLNWTQGSFTPRYYMMKERSKSVSHLLVDYSRISVYFTHLPLYFQHSLD